MRLLHFLLPALLLLTSCGNLRNLAAKSRANRQQKAIEKLVTASSEEAAARLGARAVGEITYVDDIQQFVHIRPLTGINLPVNSALETRREGKRTALLRSTPQRNRDFATADLLEGTPQTGDGVFPSTAKPAPVKPAPRPVLPPVSTSGPDARAFPGVPTGPGDLAPGLPPADDFDRANLPKLKDRVKTPEDLNR